MSVLSQIDLGLSLDEATYGARSCRYQAALRQLGQEVRRGRRPVVILLEGWPAAGRGAVIATLAHGFGPGVCRVHADGNPQTACEPARHYLCRFWQALPPRGRVAILGQSWYGRVLGDRVMGSLEPDTWRRAYREINQFERQLVDFGTILLKFWLHIDPDEQLRRLQEREASAEQAWRVTGEDWRAREHWPQYVAAVEEMVLKTSTLIAPWTVVSANDTRWARVDVARRVVATLCRELDCELDLSEEGAESTTGQPASPDKDENLPKEKKKDGKKKKKKGKKKNKK